MNRFAISALALSSVASLGLLAQGCTSPDGPGTTGKPVIHPAVGTVLVQNQGYDLVNVTVTDSSGYPTVRDIPPGLKASFNVVPGAVHVSGIARQDGSQVISQDLTIAQDTRTTVKAPVINYVVPAQLFSTDYKGAQLKAGVFSCKGHGDLSASAPVSSGGITTASITCLDPSDPSQTGLHSLTFAFKDADFTTAQRRPQPYASVLDAFNAYMSSRSKTAFQVTYNPATAVASSVVNPISFGLQNLDPQLHPANPIISPAPPQIPTQFGQLTIDHMHQDTTGNGYPATHTYDQQATLYTGNTTNTITFRYMLDLDPSQTVTGYDFEIAMVPTPAYISDPCDSWASPPGTIYLRNVPLTMTKEGGFVLTGEFTEQLNHLIGPQVYYARVVPVQAVNGLNQCVAGPSNWVTLTQSSDDPQADLSNALNQQEQAYEQAAAAAAANNAYSVSVLSYLPEGFGSADEAYRRLLITKTDNPNGWPVGCSYLAQEPPPSPPWYDQLIDGLLDALSYLAEVYDDIKSAVVDVVADAIPGCSSDPGCKAALTAGLDTGLAFIGLPPDIPNVDQIIQGGGDFLAGVASDAVTDATGIPVPDAAAQLVTNQMVSQVQGALTPGPTNKYDPFSWGRPDPFWNPYPAMLWIKVTRDSDPSKTGGGAVTIDGSLQQIWQYKTIQIPSTLKPGGSMIIPVVLQPVLIPLSDPTEDEDFNQGAELGNWYSNQYQAGAAQMHIDVKTSLNTASIDTQTGLSYPSQNNPYGLITEPATCQ